MRIDVVTIFPEMFSAACNFGVIGRARFRSLWSLHVWNPRDFSKNPRRNIDDRAYGGEGGMVMLAEPLEIATKWILEERARAGLLNSPVVLMSPKGSIFTQKKAKKLSSSSGIILICGRYKGIDQRFIDLCVTHELSLGDFIVSGGEVVALAIVDAIVRLLPGALNNSESHLHDSFEDGNSGLLDSPCYTRPRVYKNIQVPKVLLSGDHSLVKKWRRKQSLIATTRYRPDLIERAKKMGFIDNFDKEVLESSE